MTRALTILVMVLFLTGCGPIVSVYAPPADYSKFREILVTEPVFYIDGYPIRFQKEGTLIAEVFAKDFQKIYGSFYRYNTVTLEEAIQIAKEKNRDGALVVPTIEIKLKVQPGFSYSAPLFLGYRSTITPFSGYLSDFSGLTNFSGTMINQVPIYSQMTFNFPPSVKADVKFTYNVFDIKEDKLIWRAVGQEYGVDANPKALLETIDRIRSAIIVKSLKK